MEDFHFDSMSSSTSHPWDSRRPKPHLETHPSNLPSRRHSPTFELTLFYYLHPLPSSLGVECKRRRLEIRIVTRRCLAPPGGTLALAPPVCLDHLLRLPRRVLSGYSGSLGMFCPTPLRWQPRFYSVFRTNTNLVEIKPILFGCTAKPFLIGL